MTVGTKYSAVMKFDLHKFSCFIIQWKINMPIKINHVYFVYLYIARYEFVSNVICLYCEIKYFLVVWNDITKRNINRNKCITYSYLFHTTNKNTVFVDVNLRLHVYIESSNE